MRKDSPPGPSLDDDRVSITARHEPAPAALGIEDNKRLVMSDKSLLDVLTPSDDQNFAFEPPEARIAARAAELD